MKQKSFKGTEQMNDLETWREVHETLKKAVQLAQDAVAVQAAQRRFWLEELNANLGDENTGGTTKSLWKKPYVLRKKDLAVIKKSVPKSVKRKASALDSDGNNKTAKKPRKKRQDKPSGGAATKKTTTKKRKSDKKKIPLPRSSSPDEDDTMSEHSYDPDPSEHSFHDNSERSYAEERSSSAAPSATGATTLHEYHRPSSVEQEHAAYPPHHHHEYHNHAASQRRASPPTAVAWGAPIPTTTADARNLQMMAAVAFGATQIHHPANMDYPPSHHPPTHPPPLQHPYHHGWNPPPQAPAYHPHRNYASIHDVAADEDDSDQDRF